MTYVMISMLEKTFEAITVYPCRLEMKVVDLTVYHSFVHWRAMFTCSPCVFVTILWAHCFPHKAARQIVYAKLPLVMNKCVGEWCPAISFSPTVNSLDLYQDWI